MMPQTTAAALPFPEPPPPGAAIEVAPGVLWMRFPLPFALDHVNIYAIDDGDGWAIVDAGFADDTTRALWDHMLAGPLRGRPITRLIVTHHHPDHMGLAGWLCARFGLPLWMTEMEYLYGRYFLSGTEAVHGEFYERFYARHGLPAEYADAVVERGHWYMEQITPLPNDFHVLEAETPLSLGGRSFRVLKGAGHSPDQAMLHCPAEGLLLAADQVMERITPNISVHAMQPEADPLGRYLDSLAMLKAVVPEGTLTLAGHHRPMRALHARIDELAAHHADRCAIIAAACADAPRSTAEMLPLLFHRKLDLHQTSFAFAEALAHVNHMIRQGDLEWVSRGEHWRMRTLRGAGGR